MVKIRVFDTISPKAVEDLSSIAEVLDDGWDFDIAVVRSKTKVTKEFMDKAFNLKLVLRAGVGLDNVDQEYCEKKGIDVRNTAEASTISVAELVFALLLSIARRTVQRTEEIKKGTWKKEGGFELSGKTLGIVGYGRIGREVAKRAKSFGMIVVAYDPFYEKTNVPMLSFKELLRVSDIITLHTPLTNATKEIINASTIEEMKDGVILINTSRGEIINEKDLYDALVKGKVSFAGLDVFHSEPPDKKLLELENVVLTPHIGGSTVDSSDRVGEAVVDQITDYIKKRSENSDAHHLKDNFYLVTISSEDRPGITATITEILSTHNVAIMDAEQATIQGVLALSFLVEMDKSTKDKVTKELEKKAAELELNLRVMSFGELKTRKKILYSLSCLTAVPRGEVLTRVSKILFQNNANIETIRQLAGKDLVALELSVDVCRSPEIEKLKQEIMVAGKELGFDVALQKESDFRKSKRLIIFDMDGILINTDIMREIAKIAGVSEELSKLTEKVAGGNVDSKQFLHKSVLLFKGISVDSLEYIANKLSLTKGTLELVTILRNMGYKIALVSSSFTFFTDKLKEKLCLDYAFGNKLKLTNGFLSGELEEPIIDGPEKARLMLEIATKEKIPTDQIVAVGNGVDDIDMLNKAGLGIVFHAKGENKKYFIGSIVQTNLKSILYMLGASEENLV
ncbi:MAG: phosphoserine phosphatase SerB [Candidatus Bathyarchaeota archaeon]